MGRAGAAEQPSAACQHLDAWAVDLKTKCVFYAEDVLPAAEADALYEELRGSLRLAILTAALARSPTPSRPRALAPPRAARRRRPGFRS